MAPTCPPTRTTLWTQPNAEALRQAVLAEPSRPTLGQLAWLDLDRDGVRNSRKCVAAPAPSRPALPSPPEPVVLPIPNTKKGGRHA